MKIGSHYEVGKGCTFTVWSPWAAGMEVKISAPGRKYIKLEKTGRDYWTCEDSGIEPGSRYLYRINQGLERPDPASHFQPFDVHSESEVVDHSLYKWNDRDWKSIPLEDYIIYELHIGTFTAEGTFEAAADKINHLRKLGITAVEIMPVAQFPGTRNWGYDGVYPFAPQNSYGGPAGLKKLVDALHENKIAAILDVVYNHLGPEGNYLPQFAPYFNSNYRTPWGSSVNFDGEYSDEVRNYFTRNALYWLDTYHFDALRLDAVDKIYDFGAEHFLSELASEVKAYSENSGKPKYLIAESDLNDEKIIRPVCRKGCGMDSQWCDDYHHSLHAILTGEREGYYADFGSIDHFAASLKNSFYYDGKYSGYRKRKHGNNALERELKQFVVHIQNHDQTGNRAFGERISALVSFEQYKLASAAVILSPYIPLIFMGQEFYEDSPFHYFISHSDPELIQSVQKGRREEFAAFKWIEEIPDPFSEESYSSSRLKWENISNKYRSVILELYRTLIHYRKNNPLFRHGSRDDLDVRRGERNIILVHRKYERKSIYCVMNFESGTITSFLYVPEGRWKKILDTSSEEWQGPGVSSPDRLIGKEQNLTLKKESFVLYESEF